MKKIKAFFEKLRLGNAKIGRQLLIIYAFALLIPLSVMGTVLLVSGGKMISDHSMELLQADNNRVKTLLSEVTTQAYTASEDLCFDVELKQLLTRQYDTYADFVAAVNGYTEPDELVYSNRELDRIRIYCTNPTVMDYKQFRTVTDEIRRERWYQQAMEGTGAFWLPIYEEAYGSNLSNLCLVRSIVLPESAYKAVLVIRVSDSYIRSRIDSESVVDAISVDDYAITYSSRRGWYGQSQPIPIDTRDDYFRYCGEAEVEGGKYYAAVSTLHLYRTSNRLYISTLDSSGHASVRSIVTGWVLLLLAALLVPGISILLFTAHFSHRVKLLRREMGKARQQDYNLAAAFSGSDELTDVFADLKVLVQDIKEKDAKMYEAELNQQKLRNDQQAMEYKMLASQINPHYLYNTLETIRMKALTTGSREVADCVKILGKTLHYVQKNTGTAVTTLRRELEHVENYLTIQKMRFGERINYSQVLDPRLDPDSYTMLPLLLQPVVENAVVHGLEAVDGIGYIEIRTALRENSLHITVRDNGAGMTEAELERVRTMLQAPEADPHASVALYNIHKRIQLSCGAEYGLRLNSQPDLGTLVTLELPAKSTKKQS